MNEYQFAILMSIAFLNLSMLFMVLYAIEGGVLPLIFAALALGTALVTDLYGMYHNGIPLVGGGDA